MPDPFCKIARYIANAIQCITRATLLPTVIDLILTNLLEICRQGKPGIGNGREQRRRLCISAGNGTILLPVADIKDQIVDNQNA